MKKFFIMLGIWFVLIVSVIVGSELYDRFKTSKYDDTAIPYLKMVIPELSRWDPSKTKQFMSDDALKNISEDDYVKIIAMFSRVGSLKSVDDLQFEEVHSEQGVDGGKQTIVEYSVDAEYESGDAVIVVNLLHDEGVYKVQHFTVSSKALTE